MSGGNFGEPAAYASQERQWIGLPNARTGLSFRVGDGLMRLSVGVTIWSALRVAQSRWLALAGGARIILKRFGPPAFSPLCNCRICGMTRHTRPLGVWLEEFERVKKIGSSNQPDICFCRATRAGLSQARRRELWCVSSADYDLGYFDDETCRLEPLADPFGPKVLPLSSV
jgi:hypothetical protein